MGTGDSWRSVERSNCGAVVGACWEEGGGLGLVVVEILLLGGGGAVRADSMTFCRSSGDQWRSVATMRRVLFDEVEEVCVCAG